jgi:hypothetical protein
MKGIIFTEFFDLVEHAFGFEVAERLLDECDLPSGGAYTAVGTYDHVEILTLVGHLSKVTGMSASQLLGTYGEFMYPKLHAQLETMGLVFDNCFALVSALDDIIHPEVLKLYPDAELPRFIATRIDENNLTLEYSSCRPFAHMAEGLLHGCAAFFAETISVSLDHKNSDGHYTTDIHITRQ